MNEVYLSTTGRILLLLFVVVAIAKLFSYIDRILTEKFMKKFSDEKIKKIKKYSKMSIFWTTLLIGDYIVLKDILTPIENFYFRGIVYTTVTLLVSYSLKKISDALIEFAVTHSAKKGLIKMSKNVSNAIKNIVDITMFVVAFFIVLWIWGIKIGPFVTSAGIVGAAIAFAAQTTISNFFSGLIIYFDKRIRVGDYVNFNGISGVVEEIRTLSTRIRTWDNTLVTIPNSNIVNNSIEDRHLPEVEKKVKVTFSFVYGTDVDKARKVIIKTVKKIKTIIGEPSVYLVKLGDYSVDLLLVASVKSIEDVWTTTCKVNEDVYNACNKAGLEFAFPTQTIELKKAQSRSSKQVSVSSQKEVRRHS